MNRTLSVLDWMIQNDNIASVKSSPLMRRLGTAFFVATAISSTGCKGGFEAGEINPGRSEVTGCAIGEIHNGKCADKAPSMQVTDIDRVVVTPGTRVVVTGENFDNSLQLKVLSGDIQLIPSFSLAGGTQANIALPQEQETGLFSVQLTQSGISKRINLISDGGQTDLPIMTTAESQVCAGTRYYSAEGRELTGTRACGSLAVPGNCRLDGVTGCITVAGYKSADMSRLDGSKIVSGTTIAGVAGTVSNCSADGQTGCITSQQFPSAAVADLADTDIRIGKKVAGFSGRLKSHCRNGVNTGTYNYDGPVVNLLTTGVTTGTSLDHWDTIDDGGGFAGSPMAEGAPSMCDNNNWVDITTTNGGMSPVSCGSSDTCIYRDTLTNLKVTGILAEASPNTTDNLSPLAASWNVAVGACHTSTYGGYPAGTWRLPTQKELMALYISGIVANNSINFITLANMQAKFWTASSDASDTSKGWFVSIASGETSKLTKVNGSPRVICVN